MDIIRNLTAVVTAVAVLVLAAQTSAQTEQLSRIPDGTYQLEFKGGNCATLKLGGGNSYRYDKGCNGSTNYRAKNVYRSGNSVEADAATITPTPGKITSEGFEGTFSLRGRTSRITALKVD